VRGCAAAGIGLAIALWPAIATAHGSDEAERLPVMGEAPAFTLTAANGGQRRLVDLRGKVVAVTFIYTSCPDTCPLLTDKMVAVKDELGSSFDTDIAFVSITADPARDTPAALQAYAQAFGADVPGWWFLTGSSSDIAEVARAYGVAITTGSDGGVDHTLLTSLIDRRGNLRVQYLGARFDPEELRHDLSDLAAEP
jgi:protein SCO1